MTGGLVGLIVLVIIVGVVLLVAKLIIDKIPMDDTFKQIAWLLIILLAIVIVIQKALPLLGISL
jgi:di/tricarboxylate transporter